MITLFIVYGSWLRFKAQVREWYAFYFRTVEHFERECAANIELLRQLDEGDWRAFRK